MKFFRDSSNEDSIFFDEGPTVHVKIAQAINSSSIDTDPITAYRQGVSMTQQAHFDAGIVKIHAGEPGHILRKNRFGMDNSFRENTRFEEIDHFDSRAFILSQDLVEPLFFNVTAGASEQVSSFSFDGIIEPFPIREVVSFLGTEIAFRSRDIHGSMMCGGLDVKFGCEMIKTVDEFNEKTKTAAFTDLADVIDTYSTVGFATVNFETIGPFVDSRRPHGVIVSTSQDEDFISALSLMSGSTENYIGPEEWSATSGFVYDNNRFPGTDSLAFGGMTH